MMISLCYGFIFKIIGSDSMQIHEQLQHFSSISWCLTVILPHWLALNGSEHKAEIPLRSLLLRFDRYWMTFQSGGIVSVAIIWIHVSASCVLNFLNQPGESGAAFTHSFISENDLGLSLHPEMLCSCLAQKNKGSKVKCDNS